MDTTVTNRLHILSYWTATQFQKYLKFRYFKAQYSGKYSDIWKLEGSLSQMRLGNIRRPPDNDCQLLVTGSLFQKRKYVHSETTWRSTSPVTHTVSLTGKKVCTFWHLNINVTNHNTVSLTEEKVSTFWHLNINVTNHKMSLTGDNVRRFWNHLKIIITNHTHSVT